MRTDPSRPGHLSRKHAGSRTQLDATTWLIAIVIGVAVAAAPVIFDQSEHPTRNEVATSARPIR